MNRMEIKGGSNWFDPTGLQRDATKDVVSCPNCSCEWMELFLVQQYPKHNQVILGQKPASINDIGFWLFRCPKCNEVYEAPVQVGAQDAARRGYDAFIDHMMEESKAKVDGEDV